MKKALKITGITLLSIIVLLIVIPFIFQSQIKGVVKNVINDNMLSTTTLMPTLSLVMLA